MSMKNWSTTAASNAVVDSILYSEGQAPSTLNDSARAMMADVRYELATQDTIASATTTDLGSKDAGSLAVSGTTTITSFGTVSAGIRKLLTFSGALTLTHNGTSLILPGAANITTVSGDSCIAESLGSGNWKVHSFQRISNVPAVYGTGVATALAANVGSAGAPVVNGGALGTPSSGTLTNATGLPISTGVSGLGTNVATFLATPSSANLASAITDETGSGKVVFDNAPSFTTGIGIGGTAAGAGGVAFPASAVAVANANTLDDYEEGTFTPGISFGGGTTGITYGAQVGTYTKIGNFVTGYIAIVLSSKGSSTGAALLTGLPFTVGSNLAAAPEAYHSSMASSFVSLNYCNNTGTSITLAKTNGTSLTSMTDADFNNNSRFDVNFFYYV